MFIAKINLHQNQEDIVKYVEENGFATIISILDDEIATTHIPLVMKKEGENTYLYGHVSIANEQVTSIKNGSKVVAMFMEKHTYISSSWYDHVNVPTWNYIAVHMNGIFEFLDETATKQSIIELVSKYEKYSEKPFNVDQMGAEGYKKEARGLLGFRIKVEKIQASWKMSQNRDDKNYFEIIKKLKERGDALSIAIAEEMENLRKQ